MKIRTEAILFLQVCLSRLGAGEESDPHLLWLLRGWATSVPSSFACFLKLQFPPPWLSLYLTEEICLRVRWGRWKNTCSSFREGRVQLPAGLLQERPHADRTEQFPTAPCSYHRDLHSLASSFLFLKWPFNVGLEYPSLQRLHWKHLHRGLTTDISTKNDWRCVP